MITRSDIRPNIKRRGLERAWSLMHGTGLAGWFVRRRNLAGATLLMYHAITDAKSRKWVDPGYSLDVDAFESQMRFLARRRSAISLGALTDMIEAGQTPKAGSVVVTFDDGYLDNLELAGPILQEYEIPATVFVVSGWIEKVAAPWIDQLFSAINHRRGHRVVVGEETLSLDTHGAEVASYHRLSGMLLGSLPKDRTRLLHDITTQLDPSDHPPRLLMDWDEIGRWLALGDGYEIGLHTKTHTALTLLPEADQVREELAHGKAELARRFGIEAPHFSYPYGRANEMTTRVLRGSGCRSACETEPFARITAASDMFRLSRQVAPKGVHHLGFLTSGAYPEMSQKFFGRQ